MKQIETFNNVINTQCDQVSQVREKLDKITAGYKEDNSKIEKQIEQIEDVIDRQNDGLQKQKDKMEKKRSALDEKQKMKDLIQEHINMQKTVIKEIKNDTETKQQLLFDVKSELKDIQKATGDDNNEFESERHLSVAIEYELQIPEDEQDYDDDEDEQGAGIQLYKQGRNTLATDDRHDSVNGSQSGRARARRPAQAGGVGQTGCCGLGQDKICSLF